MARKKIDPTFKKRFNIETPIHYVWDVVVEDGLQDRFNRAWKRFYPKAKPLVSKTRGKSLNACMNRIYKAASDEAYTGRVSIKYIRKDIGYGVFAKCDIPPYSVLNHYAGILRLDKDIELDNDSTFNFTDFGKYSIDATKSANWSRYMNHCEESDPGNNAIPWELYLPQGPRIVFTAGSRGILKGEQILYSYGDSYWDEDDEADTLI